VQAEYHMDEKKESAKVVCMKSPRLSTPWDFKNRTDFNPPGPMKSLQRKNMNLKEHVRHEPLTKRIRQTKRIRHEHTTKGVYSS